MNKTSLIFAVVALLSIATSFSQNVLTITVDGVSSNTGNVGYAIYNTEESFLDLENVFKAEMHKAVQGKSSIEIKGLPNGAYAIAIFHDKNGNKVLDTNFLGIPKEPVAFSFGKLKTFGPPSFDECSFTFTEDTEIQITIN